MTSHTITSVGASVKGSRMYVAGIGNQQHVALVNGCPAADGRAIHAEALFEGRFAKLPDGIRNVVPEPGNIGETQVKDLHVVLLDECHDCLGIGLGISHSGSPYCRACTRFAARTWFELRFDLCGTSCPRFHQLQPWSGTIFRSRNSELRTALLGKRSWPQALALRSHSRIRAAERRG